MRYDEHFSNYKPNRPEQLSILRFHSKQDFYLALYSYARVSKCAAFSGFVVFVVMSLFLHTVLLTDGADNLTHLLAIAANVLLAFIAYHVISELHPSRVAAAEYWRSYGDKKKEIKELERETFGIKLDTSF